MKLNDEIARLTEDIEHKTNELESIKGEIEAATEKLGKAQDAYDALAGSFGTIKEDVEEIERRYAEKALKDNLPGQAAESLDFETVKTQMRNPVEQHILSSALMALHTNQLIVLTGKPGTGKSTFASDLAYALGAQFTSIEVQPSWADSESLLGYYNPMNHRYSETPFIRALLDAKNDWETMGADSRLHIICLDEMNLARVEYYFATFLSIMQAQPGKRTVRLLPPDIESQLGSAELAGLEPYKSFELPGNVHFIGTINMDDTTYDLSPKVIDRSFFITFDSAKSADSETDTAAQGPAEYQPAARFAVTELEAFEYAKTPFEEWGKNPRFAGYCNTMWTAYKRLFDADDSQANAFADAIILSKVLPSLPMRRQGEEDAIIGQITSEAFPQSQAHIAKMRAFAELFGALTFFCER